VRDRHRTIDGISRLRGRNRVNGAPRGALGAVSGGWSRRQTAPYSISNDCSCTGAIIGVDCLLSALPLPKKA